MTIAAGATLTKDVPENNVVGRISAKVINSFNNNFCKYNVTLKVFLQNTVFTLFSWLNQRKHHDSRKIMLYSNMGFRYKVKAI